MILFTVVFALVASSCIKGGSWACSDDASLMLCFRAQDRVNWLIEKINDTIEPLFLNCSQHVIADERTWNNELGVSVYYSTKNQASCFRAAKVFDELVQKYLLQNVLPVECEQIKGSQDNASTALFCAITMKIFATLLHFV